MGPLDVWNLISGIGGTVGGLAQSWGTREDLKRSLAPGGMPGTLTPGQASTLDLAGFGEGPNADILRNQFRTATQTTSGLPFLAAQNVADQDALNRQRPYAEE